MTTLETKIFDFIEDSYDAKFLGKVKVDITGEDKVITTTTTTDVVTSTNQGIKYGRLYNWYAITDPREIAPIGWHVPTTEEWGTLINYIGATPESLGKLKETGTTYWSDPNINATNETGFSALPGGYLTISNYNNPNYPDSANFYNLGESGFWWSSSKYDKLNAWYISIHNIINSNNIPRNNSDIQTGLSVRLIKNTSINEGDIIIDGDTYNTVTIGDQIWLKQNLATLHYRNGDLIGTNTMNRTESVSTYVNDESNVYKIITTTTPVTTTTTTIIPVLKEYCLLITLSNYMIPLPICIQCLSDNDFFTYICKELNTRNFPVVKYFKLIKNDTNDDKDII